MGCVTRATVWQGQRRPKMESFREESHALHSFVLFLVHLFGVAPNFIEDFYSFFMDALLFIHFILGVFFDDRRTKSQRAISY
jgi:hypothetical protein